MPVGAPGTGRDRRYGAQMREGSLAAKAVGVVAGGDEHLRGDLGADAKSAWYTGASQRPFPP